MSDATPRPAGSRCRFLTRNDKAALSVAFCNYLSIGQFELARAVFLRLHAQQPVAAARLADTIAALGPPSRWLNSISVPSSAHLSWMVAALAAQASAQARPRDLSSRVQWFPKGRRAQQSQHHSARSNGYLDSTGLPMWKKSQLEFDILLTEGLLDGAASNLPQTFTREVVSDLRTRFFKAVTRRHRHTGGKQRGSPFFQECTAKTADRLPPLQLLPIPNFLPPVESVLPEKQVELNGEDPMDQLHTPDLSVHEQLEKMMLAQPLVGRALWKMLVYNLCGEPEMSDVGAGFASMSASGFLNKNGFRGLLKGLGVKLVQKCFDQGHYKDGVWFLQALYPTTNAEGASRSSKEDDWYETDVDMLFSKIIEQASSSVDRGEASSKLSKGADDVIDSKTKVPKEVFHRNSSPPPDSRYLHAALLSQKNTALLTRFCLQEDKHLLEQLEQSTLPPPFLAYHCEHKKRHQPQLQAEDGDHVDNSNIGPNQHVFWGRFFTLMWVSRKHCLEFVLRRGLEFVHDRDFDNAAKLLSPFPRLRPLLLILSVDHPSMADIEAKQKLIAVLWKGARRTKGFTSGVADLQLDNMNESNDPETQLGVQSKGYGSERNIEKWCDQIEFVVDLTLWYTEKYLGIPANRRVNPAVKGVWRAESIRGIKTGDANQGDDKGGPEAGESQGFVFHNEAKMSRRDRIANAVLIAFEKVSMLRVMRESLPALDNTVSSLLQLMNQAQFDMAMRATRHKPELGSTTTKVDVSSNLNADHSSDTKRERQGVDNSELLRFLVQRPRGTETVDMKHRDDLVVLRGYYVLKQVMAWFDMTAQLRAREEEESRLQLVLLRQNRLKQSRRQKESISRAKGRKKRSKRRKVKPNVSKTKSIRAGIVAGDEDFVSTGDDEFEEDEGEDGETSENDLDANAETVDISAAEDRISHNEDDMNISVAPEDDSNPSSTLTHIKPVIHEQSPPSSSGKKSKKSIDGSSVKTARKILKKHIHATMSTVENHVMEIASLPSRVTILENMFRLLFVKRSDLKNNSNGEIDVGQKHTTTAVGGTGMTSEREDEPSRDSYNNQRESYIVGTDIFLSASEAEAGSVLSAQAVASIPSANESSTNEASISSKRHMYIADADLVSAVLKLLRVCLVKTVEEASESTTLQQRDQVALYRAKGLLGEVVDNGHFVDAATGTEIGEAKVNGDDILEISFIDDLTKLRQSSLLKQTKKSGNLTKTDLGSSPTFDDLGYEALDPHLHTFYMTVDLAVSVAPTAVHSQRLLSEAQNVLDKWLYADKGYNVSMAANMTPKTNIPAEVHKQLGGSDGLTFEKGLHDYFSNLVIRRYGKLIDNERNQMMKGNLSRSSEELPPLWTLLKQVENMPMEPTILESHLSNMRSRDHVLDSLKSVFDSNTTTYGEDKSNEVSIDDVMTNFIRQFAKEGFGEVHDTGGMEDNSITDGISRHQTPRKKSDGSEISVSNEFSDPLGSKETGQYLLQFLRYIMTISNSLRSAASANQKQKTFDVAAILSRSPRTILADLIFRLGGLKEAERLAKLMRLDLAKVILRSSGGVNTASTNISRVNQTVDVVYSKTSNGIDTAKLVSEMSDDGRQGYRLDMDIISYLAALEHSNSPLKGLRLSSSNRAQAWANLIQIFLDGSAYDEDENDEQTKSKRFEKMFSLHFSARDFAKYAKFSLDNNDAITSSKTKSPNLLESQGGAERKRPAIINQCILWLEQEGLETESLFYIEAIKELRSQGFLTAALSLADAVLPSGSRVERTEQILKRLVHSCTMNRGKNQMTTSMALHKYIRRMKDHQAAARFTLKYLREFMETNTAIELLYMCICQLRRIGSSGIFPPDMLSENMVQEQGNVSNSFMMTSTSDLQDVDFHDEYSSKGSAAVAETQMLYRRVVEEHANLQAYRSIMLIPKMAISFSNRWQKLDEMCFSKPDTVIDRLLTLNQHDLAMRVVEMHQNRILEGAMSYDKSLIIAHNVLSMVEDLSVKLLLAQFIMKTAANHQAEEFEIYDFAFLSTIPVVELSLKLLIK
eukprot:g4230.t1